MFIINRPSRKFGKKSMAVLKIVIIAVCLIHLLQIYMQEILKTTMKLIKRYSTFAQMDEKFS
jgi:hypothetical protein